MHRGIFFHLVGNRDLYLMDGNGKCTPLIIKDNIPYIKLNDPKKRHRKFHHTESSIIHSISKMVADGTLENERVEYDGDDEMENKIPELTVNETSSGLSVIRLSKAPPGVEGEESEAPLPKSHVKEKAQILLMNIMNTEVEMGKRKASRRPSPMKTPVNWRSMSLMGFRGLLSQVP